MFKNKLSKVLSNIFLLLTSLIHMMFFKVESIDFLNPEILQRFGLNETTGKVVEVWAYNQGFYNLFLAIGLIYALYLINFKKDKAGVTLASFICLSIFFAGVVLYVSAPQKLTAAMIQSIPALAGLVILNTTVKSK